jgi:PAS domain S-box-containing protein
MALIAEADIEIDPDGLVVGWDSGAVRLFGYQATEALGVALSDLIVPGRLRAAHRDGLRRIRSGTGPHSSCRPCTATGTSSSSRRW